MRICFLAQASTIHTYRWIQYFATKGHEIHLISYEEYKFRSVDNLIVHRITPIIENGDVNYFVRLLFFLVNQFLNIFIKPYKVKKLIRTINPDILHAHYLTSYGILGYFMHFPIFVLTLWGSDILLAPKKFPWNKIMAKLVLNSAKLITCDSITVRNECYNYCKHPEKVEVIQWGIDLSIFREKSNDRTKRNNITILSTRNFKPIYNIDIIVQSIPYIIGKHPNVRFILKNWVGDLSSELQQLAISLNVTKNIDFVNKVLDDNELPELFNVVDIFVSVPSSDSSSISLHEAMACGLPAIVSDISANREWIIDGWNGFIVPVRNPEKLANAIIQLIEKPDLMQLFGVRNAQIIRDRADREKHMTHMENLYQELIEKNK